MQARRVRRGARAVLAVGVALAVLAACTSSDDDGTEVAGAALERGDDDEPVGLDDERVDPRDEPPASDPDDEPESDDAPDGPPDDAPDADSGDAGDDADGADDAPPDGEDEAADGGDDASTGEGSGQGSDASPPPPASPTPVTLTAGVGLRGDVVGFAPDGAEVLVGGPVESPPAVGARADAVRIDGADEVRCHSTLQAPQDRGLVARGDLEIALLLERHDGTSQRVPLLVMELDVSIAAGVRYELPTAPTAPTSGGRGFDRDDVASLACQATFTPRSG